MTVTYRWRGPDTPTRGQVEAERERPGAEWLKRDDWVNVKVKWPTSKRLGQGPEAGWMDPVIHDPKIKGTSRPGQVLT
jgi:hypothetical protein